MLGLNTDSNWHEDAKISLSLTEIKGAERMEEIPGKEEKRSNVSGNYVKKINCSKNMNL